MALAALAGGINGAGGRAGGIVGGIDADGGDAEHHDEHHHDDDRDDPRDDDRGGRRRRAPAAAKAGRTATIPQTLICPTHFMTLNRYLGESTIFLGGGGGVLASHQQVAWR